MNRRGFLQGIVGGIVGMLAGRLPWFPMLVGIGGGSPLVMDNWGMTIEFQSERTGGAWILLPPLQSWSELDSP